MGGCREARIGRLREAILDYVRVHPGAADTPPGVVRWWLPSALAMGAAEMIDDVLDELARADVLQRVRLPDGAVLYAARTSTDADAQAPHTGEDT